MVHAIIVGLFAILPPNILFFCMSTDAGLLIAFIRSRYNDPTDYVLGLNLPFKLRGILRTEDLSLALASYSL